MTYIWRCPVAEDYFGKVVGFVVVEGDEKQRFEFSTISDLVAWLDQKKQLPTARNILLGGLIRTPDGQTEDSPKAPIERALELLGSIGQKAWPIPCEYCGKRVWVLWPSADMTSLKDAGGLESVCDNCEHSDPRYIF